MEKVMLGAYALALAWHWVAMLVELRQIASLSKSGKSGGKL